MHGEAAPITATRTSRRGTIRFVVIVIKFSSSSSSFVVVMIVYLSFHAAILRFNIRVILSCVGGSKDGRKEKDRGDRERSKRD